MSRFKYIESNIPDSARLQVRYYHAGNSTYKERAAILKSLGEPRRRVRYLTVAVLSPREQRAVGTNLSPRTAGVSVCGPRRRICKKIERAKAVGRCLKKYTEQYACMKLEERENFHDTMIGKHWTEVVNHYG